MKEPTVHWTHVLAFGIGYATCALTLLVAVSLGSAARRGDEQAEGAVELVRASRLGAVDFDEEAFYGWAERGGRN